MPRRVGAVFVFGVALAGAVFLQERQRPMRRPSPVTPPSGPMSPRQLLESPEFAHHAALQVVGVVDAGKTMDSQELARVTETLNRGFRAYVRDLEEHNPQTAAVFEKHRLTDDQQRAVFRVVGHLADPRLRDLGKKIARVVQAHENEGQAAIEDHIRQELELNSRDLRALQNELAPGSRRLPRNMSVVLTPERVRAMATFDGWDVKIDFSSPRTKLVPSPALRRLGEFEGWSAGKDLTKVQTWLRTSFKICDLVREALIATGMKMPYWVEPAVDLGFSLEKGIISCMEAQLNTPWDYAFCAITNISGVIWMLLNIILGTSAPAPAPTR